MKLELYGLIQSLLEAGGKFAYDMYAVRDGNGDVIVPRTILHTTNSKGEQ
jgi:hypothetical protein